MISFPWVSDPEVCCTLGLGDSWSWCDTQDSQTHNENVDWFFFLTKPSTGLVKFGKYGIGSKLPILPYTSPLSLSHSSHPSPEVFGGCLLMGHVNHHFCFFSQKDGSKKSSISPEALGSVSAYTFLVSFWVNTHRVANSVQDRSSSIQLTSGCILCEKSHQNPPAGLTACGGWAVGWSWVDAVNSGKIQSEEITECKG